MSQLFHGDCFEIMNTIPNKSVDMVLCDLPYGMTKNRWDIVLPFEDLWEQYNRIVKENGAVLLFGCNPFTAQLICSNLNDFRYTLVWEKNKSSDFLNSKRKPLKSHEDIAVFYKKQPVYNPQFTYGKPYKRWNKQKAVDKQTNYGSHKANVAESTDGRRYPTTVLKFARKERPNHPTEKPVELLRWLIRTYTNEGDTVLDNCMGSGSCGEAAITENRQFIGIEKNQDYFEFAKNRMNSIGEAPQSSKRKRDSEE